MEAEIQSLNEVISDQQRYIQELHKNHVGQLELIPNLHLGAGKIHKGVGLFLLSRLRLAPHELNVCVQTALTCLLMETWPAGFTWSGPTALPLL